jgi:ABC-type branched-subunit amino acid transport system ATPase component
MIETRELSKRFGGIRAVDKVSSIIEKNKITSIIGPNGAGKTTFFNVITGFLKPDQGKVVLHSEEITGLAPYQIARKGIARTFQDLRLIRQVSVLDNVLLARQDQLGENAFYALIRWKVKEQEKQNLEVAESILEFVGLKDFRHEKAENLSYGQQKLLTIACCLAMEAPLLLLDEPVAGIHPEMISKILQLLKELVEQGKTIVFIEHDIEAVRQVSDHVIVMDEGKIIASGKPQAVLEDPQIVEAYLG